MKRCNHSEEFRHSGLKFTKHRADILDILEKSDRPIPAETVYLELKEREVPIHLSTVYRTLDALSAKGILNKLSISGDSRAFFEYNRKIHQHYLVCMGCKKILPVTHCPLEEYEKSLAAETHFVIEGHKLDIYGYCPECAGKRRNRDTGEN